MFFPCAYLTLASQGQRKNVHTLLSKLEIKLGKLVEKRQQRGSCLQPPTLLAFRFLLSFSSLSWLGIDRTKMTEPFHLNLLL